MGLMPAGQLPPANLPPVRMMPIYLGGPSATVKAVQPIGFTASVDKAQRRAEPPAEQQR